MASPTKVALRAPLGQHNAWEYFENVHANHVRSSFGLFKAFADHAHLIRRWDLIALATERAALMPQDDGEGWAILDGVAPWRTYDFRAHQIFPWDFWRDLFLQKYNELRAL